MRCVRAISDSSFVGCLLWPSPSHLLWWSHTYCCSKFTSIYRGETEEKWGAPECDQGVPAPPDEPVGGPWYEAGRAFVLVVLVVQFVRARSGAAFGGNRLVATRK